MAQNFLLTIHSKPPKKNNVTNKKDVYRVDGIWSVDILDIRDSGPANKRNYRYVLVIMDNFSKFCWTLPLKNKKN